MEFAAPQNLSDFRVAYYMAKKIQANYLQTGLIQESIVVLGAYLQYESSIPAPVGNADVLLGAVGYVNSYEDQIRLLYLRDQYASGTGSELQYGSSLKNLLSIGVVPDFMSTYVDKISLYDSANTATSAFVICLVKKR